MSNSIPLTTFSLNTKTDYKILSATHCSLLKLMKLAMAQCPSQSHDSLILANYSGVHCSNFTINFSTNAYAILKNHSHEFNIRINQ